MKLFGPAAVLTEMAIWIMQENITALEANVTDVDAPFEITSRIIEPPIILAIYENKSK
jgi:hypothetical protein